MLPDNIAQFVAEKDQNKLEAVKAALANPDDLQGNLERLGSLWRIRVEFSEPVWILVNGRKSKQTTNYTFAGFFKSRSSNFAYAVRRVKYGRLWGFDANNLLDKIVRYSLVEPGDPKEFSGLEQFARRFDRRFITEAAINDLWAKKSSQHGRKYRPSDFRPIGRKGARVMREFIEKFAGINAPSNKHYTTITEENGNNIHTLCVCENAFGSRGRRISIEHKVGMPYVWYFSEYPGCGNGRYGLIATEKTYLCLENS